MRVEIEAAALFITRLVNKNLSQASSNSNSPGSSASSTHSSSSYSSSDSPPAPGYDCPQQLQPEDQCPEDKVEQFRQCLMKALHDRFHNHWFPEKPSKGQAYRCIRLNGIDRHDETLQQACSQCGINYKDLQLPVELTLWVDPDEVTCRFGENKGSHCLVAKFKDGELQDNNLDLDDIHNINIEFFPQQTTTEKMRQLSINDAHVDYNTKKHQNHHHLTSMSMNNNLHNTSISSLKSNSSPQMLHNHNQHHQNHQHHQQTQIINHHNHHQQQQPPQQPPHNQYHHNNNHLQQQHHHQKTAILPNYHNNYLNDNPIYYYF